MAFDPYDTWLGIPKSQQPPTLYRLIGVPDFESDPDLIHRATLSQIARLRRFQAGEQFEINQRLMNEVSQARLTLLDPEKRTAYNALLQSRHGTTEAITPSDPVEDEDDGKSDTPSSLPLSQMSNVNTAGTLSPTAYKGVISAAVLTVLLLSVLSAGLIFALRPQPASDFTAHEGSGTAGIDLPHAAQVERAPGPEPANVSGLVEKAGNEAKPSLAVPPITAEPPPAQPIIENSEPAIWEQDLTQPLAWCWYGGAKETPTDSGSAQALITVLQDEECHGYLPVPSGPFRLLMHFTRFDLGSGRPMRIAALETPNNGFGVELDQDSNGTLSCRGWRGTHTPHEGTSKAIVGKSFWLALERDGQRWSVDISLDGRRFQNVISTQENLDPVAIGVILDNPGVGSMTVGLGSLRVTGEDTGFASRMENWPSAVPLPPRSELEQSLPGMLELLPNGRIRQTLEFGSRAEIELLSAKRSKSGAIARQGPVIPLGPYSQIQRIEFRIRFLDPGNGLDFRFAEGTVLRLEPGRGTITALEQGEIEKPGGKQLQGRVSIPIGTVTEGEIDLQGYNSVQVTINGRRVLSGQVTGLSGELALRVIGSGEIEFQRIALEGQREVLPHWFEMLHRVGDLAPTRIEEDDASTVEPEMETPDPATEDEDEVTPSADAATPSDEVASLTKPQKPEAAEPARLPLSEDPEWMQVPLFGPISQFLVLGPIDRTEIPFQANPVTIRRWLSDLANQTHPPKPGEIFHDHAWRTGNGQLEGTGLWFLAVPFEVTKRSRFYLQLETPPGAAIFRLGKSRLLQFEPEDFWTTPRGEPILIPDQDGRRPRRNRANPPRVEYQPIVVRVPTTLNVGEYVLFGTVTIPENSGALRLQFLDAKGEKPTDAIRLFVPRESILAPE